MEAPSSDFVQDKLFGAFMGLLLGDALGAPHEFHSSLEFTGKLEHQLRVRWRCHSDRIMPPGSITDDSEMTLALLGSIIKARDYDQKVTLQSYLDWANSGCPFLGKNTRKLFKGVITIKGAQKRMDCAEDQEKIQSNGTLMRCLPLVLFKEEVIEADVNLTNPNDLNREANLTYLTAIYRLLYGGKPREILEEIGLELRDPELKRAYQQIIKGKKRDITGETKGWVVHAWYCAFRALASEDSFETQMEWIIGHHPNSDTDTNAAIAGAMLGARYGQARLLESEQTLNNWLILEAASDQESDIIRPKEYSVSALFPLLRKYCSLFL
jgi:ADP-ribosylglycohydrolase